MTKDLRIQVRLKNNRLLTAREELGISAARLADDAGISYHTYLKLEGMSLAPITKTGEWRVPAKKIAIYHGISPEDLWPDSVKGLTVSGVISTQANLGEIENGLQSKEESTLLKQAIQCLSPVQIKLLHMKYWRDMDLAEIAKYFGFSSTRARQIHEQSKWKLQKSLKRLELHSTD